MFVTVVEQVLIILQTSKYSPKITRNYFLQKIQETVKARQKVIRP